MTYVIEKNVLVPTGRRDKSELTIALLRLEVGESFVCAERPNGAKLLRHPGRKYTARKVDGGVRVWRIA